MTAFLRRPLAALALTGLALLTAGCGDKDKAESLKAEVGACITDTPINLVDCGDATAHRRLVQSLGVMGGECRTGTRVEMKTIVDGRQLGPASVWCAEKIGSTTSTTDSGWNHFASFTKLVGTSSGGAYLQAQCRLTGEQASVTGHVDGVLCSIPGTIATFAVDRYSSEKDREAVTDGLRAQGYFTTTWPTDGSASHGNYFDTPSTTIETVIVADICAQPLYLVTFKSTNRASFTFDQLKAHFDGATIPDTKSPC